MSDTDGDDVGLGDMFPREPTPPPPSSTVQTFSAPYLPHGPLSIHLVGTDPLWGHLLWNASRVLADYLYDERVRLVEGKTVLELGAGGGLPSLVAGCLGASKVVCTDYPDKALLGNLTRNRDENARPTASSGSAESRGYPQLAQHVVIEGHLWGKKPEELLQCLPEDNDSSAEAGPSKPSDRPHSRRRYDTLILSDLIFNHSQHAALLDTCEAVITPSTGLLAEDAETGHPESRAAALEAGAGGVALVFHSHHLPQHKDRDLGFFRLARDRGWHVRQVLKRRVGVMFEEDGGDVEDRAHVWGWELRWPGSGGGREKESAVEV